MKKDILIIGIISLILILLTQALIKNGTKMPPSKVQNTDSVVTSVPEEYGFRLDSFQINKYEIESGENLSVILEKLGFDSQQRYNIAVAAKTVVDVRKFRAGAPYALVKPLKLITDSMGVTDTTSFFVYEPSATEYVVFTIGDSIQAQKVKRKLIVKEREAAGIITTSLWNACVNNGFDPMVAIKLSNVFAWSIDFFGLQKGDRFKVVYEETTIEGNNDWYKIGKIKSAVFNHLGKDYFAIPYNTGRDSGYFDQDGKSLKTFFLKAPLNYSRISSKFSNSRLHPILKIYRPHHGVDYSAPTGTPVHTIADGIVIVANYSKSAGNWVKIKHGTEYTTAYMHLHGFAGGIKRGARVSQGQIIGYVGSTGLSTGPHLDFRFWRKGKPVDPLKVVGPPSQPVPEEQMKKFNEIKSKVIARLDKIIYPVLKAMPVDTIDTDTLIENISHDESVGNAQK